MPRRDFSKVAFAATGDTNSIPTATQPDGSVSLSQGYGFDYQRDNGAGGGTPDPLAKNIDREDMNGILNEITASIGELQQNGSAIWVASAAPYPINSEVMHNGVKWRSAVANNSSQPGTDASWFNSSIGAATETSQGILKIATAAQVSAGADDTTAMTPKKFVDAFKAPNSNSAQSGFERMPSGIIRNWGTIALSAVGNFNTQVSAGVTWYTQFYVVNLPQAYTTRHCSILANLAGPTSGAQAPGALAFIKTNKTTAGPGESLTAFSVAITTPVLGLVPTIHFEGTGI